MINLETYIKAGILLLISLCISIVSLAQSQMQVFKGVLRASDDFEYLNAVLVKDLTTGNVVLADTEGYFEIRTAAGHQLEFSRVGVKTISIKVEEKMFRAIQQILLKLEIGSLEGVSVLNKTKYYQDSLARYQLYQKDLERQKDKMTLNKEAPDKQGFGLTLDNPISSWMQYIAPKSKNRLRFQHNFSEWEKQKYIETIYTAEKVQQITGLKNDTLAWFINAYPMPYEMARTAKAKEIEVWIKGNFDDWQKNPQKIIKLFRLKEFK